MNEDNNHLPQFIRFLEEIEQAADRVVWSSRRVRDELRGDRNARMRDADYALFKLLSNANRFIDHLARHHIVTTQGADNLASFLLTSAREVIRETRSEQAWGWAPKHNRRRKAEWQWKLAQGVGFFGAVEQLIRQQQQRGASCGKQ